MKCAANKSAPVNAPIASRFQFGHPGRRVIESHSSARLSAMRSQRSNLKRLMAIIVVAAGSFLNPALRACQIEGPDEKITVAHFWVASVGDADFGVREWRCSGNASAGVPARTYTTVFVGWGEISTRVSALAVVSIAIGGLCAIGLVCSAMLRTFGRQKV